MADGAKIKYKGIAGLGVFTGNGDLALGVGTFGPCALIMELAANAPACRAANSMINAGIAQLGRGAKKS
jgi:hypothetical protein